MEKGRTSFSGFKWMEAFLLETQRLARNTSHLTPVKEVMVPTVLRCLKWAGSRSWIKMAKQCGLLIRPKLSAWIVINIQTTCAQTAITQKQRKSVQEKELNLSLLVLVWSGTCTQQTTISQRMSSTSIDMSIFWILIDATDHTLIIEDIWHTTYNSYWFH